jgi:fatty acid desaturase
MRHPDVPRYVEILLIVGDWLLYAGLPAMVLFTILYGARSKWRQTKEGTAVFYLGLSITLIAIHVAITLWLGAGWFGYEYVRILIYGFFCLCAWRLFVTLVRSQNRSDDEAGLRRDTRTFTE